MAWPNLTAHLNRLERQLGARQTVASANWHKVAIGDQGQPIQAGRVSRPQGLPRRQSGRREAAWPHQTCNHPSSDNLREHRPRIEGAGRESCPSPPLRTRPAPTYGSSVENSVMRSLPSMPRRASPPPDKPPNRQSQGEGLAQPRGNGEDGARGPRILEPPSESPAPRSGWHPLISSGRATE